MLRLKEFNDSKIGFPSLLTYFGLADDGIILNKDGSLLCGFRYRGKDIESMTYSERDKLSLHVNNILKQLSTGWMLNINAIRIDASEYISSDHFPDYISQMVEQERKEFYNQSDEHFENQYFMTLTYKEKLLDSRKISKLFFTQEINTNKNMDDILLKFKEISSNIKEGLSSVLSISKMNSSELLNHLMLCIHGKDIPLNIDNNYSFINHKLGAYDFVGGLNPTIDNSHIGIIAIDEFPMTTFSNMLDILNELPFSYRVSSRFIFMDTQEAVDKLKKVRNKFSNNEYDIFGHIMQTISPGSESKFSNKDAVNKSYDADEAITEANEGLVKYGYYTFNVILFDQDQNILQEKLNNLKKRLENNGFITRIETFNAIEAYLGSLPGNSYANLRKPLINTCNLTHLLPLSSIWSGEKYNSNPFYEKDSPSLFYAITNGSTPFRFNIHMNDVGHTLILGPTGSGKSTLLSLICAQFLKYKNAQIFCFEKGLSQYVLTNACSGKHYNIMNEDDDLSFCPLYNIDDKQEQIWALEWITQLIELQGVVINPDIKSSISSAIQSIANASNKTLSNFYMKVQNQEIKSALEPFVRVKDGILSNLLDCDNNNFKLSHFNVFELENLMNKNTNLALPVLTYMFHMVEKQLDGRPSIIVLDEAWVMLSNDVFRNKIQEWLKVLRKKNTAVIFATQSIADIINSPIKDSLIESCLTKIFLPNASADTEYLKESYKSFGLNSKEISIIANSIPKQHYYFNSGKGSRLIELGLGEFSKQFLCVSDPKNINFVQSLKEKYKNFWCVEWLLHRGFHKEAMILKNYIVNDSKLNDNNVEEEYVEDILENKNHEEEKNEILL